MLARKVLLARLAPSAASLAASSSSSACLRSVISRATAMRMRRASWCISPHAQLQGEVRAVLALALKLAPSPLAEAHPGPRAASVGDDARDRLPHDLLAPIAEHPFGRGIEGLDGPRLVAREDAVHGVVEHGLPLRAGRHQRIGHAV